MQKHFSLSQYYNVIGILYIIFAALLFWSAPLREYSDTYLYYGLSPLPITHVDFWAGNRQFVPLLLFKAFHNQPLPIAYTQFLISMGSWIFLASMTRRMLRQPSFKLIGFCLVLLYSLSAEVFLWHRVLYTESLSTSFFVLLVGVGIWGLSTLRDKADLRLQIQVSLIALVAMFLWAMTRDTNAYSVVGISLMVGAWVVLRRTWRYMPLVMCLIIGSLLIFWLQDYTANQGERWHYPLVNVISNRILVDPDKTAFFVERGMPYNPDVQALTQQDPVVDWTPIADWLGQDGKSTYAEFLLSDPIARVRELVQHWGQVFNDNMYAWSGRGVPPTWQGLLSFVLYPKGFWLLGLGIAGIMAAASLLWRGQWTVYWLVPIALIILIFPQAFLNWHGDTLDMDRHVLGVTTLTHIGVWLLLLLVVDGWGKSSRKVLVLASAILVLGLGLEASLQADVLMNHVTAPVIYKLFPEYNVLANWGVTDAEYTLYQKIPADSHVVNPRVIRPSTTSGSIDIYLFDSPLDGVAAHLAHREAQDSIDNWKRTALPGYMKQFTPDYLFFEERWWDSLTEFQRSTLQDETFYTPLDEWYDTASQRTYHLYRVVSDRDHWDDQSQPAVVMRGLSDEAYQLFVEQQASYNLVPSGEIIFSPEQQLEDRLTTLTKLGRFISSMTDEQRPWLDLMITLERASYQEDLPSQAAAIQQWRATKQADELEASGIHYLLFSRQWWEFLSDSEKEILNNPQHYDLIQEWQVDNNGVFYRLYRLPKRDGKPLALAMDRHPS